MKTCFIEGDESAPETPRTGLEETWEAVYSLKEKAFCLWLKAIGGGGNLCATDETQRLLQSLHLAAELQALAGKMLPANPQI